MTWENRKPEGVGDIEHTPDGFQTTVAMPVDDDGYFGRECPDCREPFKLRHDEYKALPDALELTCPYCGHRDEHSAFITIGQKERATEAMKGLAHQMLHAEMNKIFSSTFGRSQPARPRSAISIEWSYKPGSPPPIRALPDVIEEEIRRVIHCSTCGNHYAVFSATSFCPVCGPRPAADTVLEAINAARQALAVEDRIETDERENLRAAGVCERFAVDGLTSVVSLFEQFARDQFHGRAADADDAVRGKGNIFQRLDDTAQIFSEHAGVDLVSLAGGERWQRLRQAFAQRHVLAHRGGIVDQRFLDQVPDAGVSVGQRLVVRRSDAEGALDDLEALVRELKGVPPQRQREPSEG